MSHCVTYPARIQPTRLWTSALFGLFLVLSFPSSGAAQGACAGVDSSKHGTRFALWTSSAAFAGALAGSALLWLPQQRRDAWHPQLDASVSGSRRPAAELASHLTVATAGAFALWGSLHNAVRCGRRTGSALAALLPVARGAHALLWTAAAAEWTKRLSGRPRPYLALNGQTVGHRDYRSFFSGHAALAASGAAHGMLEWLRGTQLSHTLQLTTGAATGAAWGALTGWLRVRDGVHYWSDVAVGLASGLLITVTPALPARVSNHLSIQLGNGLSVRWTH